MALEKKDWIIIMALFFIAVLLRALFLPFQLHAGHGDSVFYFTAAKNMYLGKGYTLDYIWHYLSIPDSITHPAGDYWMPLPVILFFLSFKMFGLSISTALIPSIIFGALNVVLTYIIGALIFQDRKIAVSAAIVAVFHKWFFFNALRTDTTVIAAVFGGLALLFLALSFKNSWYMVISGVFIGLSGLTRSDGVLLYATLLLSSIFIFKIKKKFPYRELFCAVLVSLIILSPLLGYNYMTFGSLSPNSGAHTKSLFMESYEDFFTFNKTLTLQTYLDWGVKNIVLSKVQAFSQNLAFFATRYLQFLFPFVFFSFAYLFRKKDFFPFYFHFLLYFSVSTFLFTFPSMAGSFAHALPLFLAFFLNFGFYAFFETIQRLNVYMKKKRAYNLDAKKLWIALIVSMVVLNVAYTSYSFYAKYQADKKIQAQYTGLNEFIKENNLQDAIFMSRNTWDLNEYSNVKALQIPSDGLKETMYLAEKYGAQYIIYSDRRPFLNDIGNMTSMFSKVYEKEGMIVYKIIRYDI